MSIKSDRWIIEKAEQGMIFPFSRNQVKLENNKTGENTLVINAPGGGWLYTAEFIALLNEHSQFFNVTATYDWDNDPPYQSVNQN